MTIEIYVDILCPWCYIAKRRIDAALASLPKYHRPPLRWRSFELSPQEGRTPQTTAADAIRQWRGEQEGNKRIEHLRTLGAAEGLELNVHLARPVNTFDAHQLIQLAAARGRGDEILERLFHAYHTEGRNVADPAVLESLGAAAGLESTDVQRALTDALFATDVRADEQRAAQLGVTGVPTLVVNEQPLGSAVREPEELRRIFEGATTERSTGQTR